MTTYLEQFKVEFSYLDVDRDIFGINPDLGLTPEEKCALLNELNFELDLGEQLRSAYWAISKAAVFDFNFPVDKHGVVLIDDPAVSERAERELIAHSYMIIAAPAGFEMNAERHAFWARNAESLRKYVNASSRLSASPIMPTFWDWLSRELPTLRDRFRSELAKLIPYPHKVRDDFGLTMPEPMDRVALITDHKVWAPLLTETA